jgi:hypothetical protein
MTHLKGEATSWIFSLWGYLKNIVCATAADYVEETRQRVAYTCELVLNAWNFWTLATILNEMQSVLWRGKKDNIWRNFLSFCWQTSNPYSWKSATCKYTFLWTGLSYIFYLYHFEIKWAITERQSIQVPCLHRRTLLLLCTEHPVFRASIMLLLICSRKRS